MALEPTPHIVTPAGGMNQDDSMVTPDPESESGVSGFQAGDYKYAAHCRIGSSRDDSFGDLENIIGTTEVTAYRVRSGGVWISGTRPSGTERVIGRLKDQEFLRVYYAVYNSNSDHCIRYYDAVTDAVYELLRWSGLLYQPTYFVKMARLDNWLATTDRNNSPRLMEVTTISDLYNSLTSNFREFHISFHKWAPVMPPVVSTFFTPGLYRFKNKGLFQFTYRYIYYGGLRSRFSPISVAHAQKKVNNTFVQYNLRVKLPGAILDQPGVVSQYNFFGHNDIKFTSAVEYIEIAFRRNSVDLWKIWKRVKTSELPVGLSWDFYNDEFSAIAQTSDVNQPVDYVPFKAGTVEAIDNRFVFGDTLEEYPIAQQPVITDVSVVKEPALNVWNTDGGYSGMSGPDQTEYIARNLNKYFTFKARGQYKVAFIYQDHRGWKSLGYTSDNLFYEIDAVPANTFTWGAIKYTEPNAALAFKLDASFVPPDWAVAYQIVRTNCINIEYFILATANKFDYLIDDPAVVRDQIEAPQAVKDSINAFFNNDRLVTSTEAQAQVTELTRIDTDNNNIARKLIKKFGAKLNPLAYQLVRDRRKNTVTTTLSSASRIYIDVNNWVNGSKSNPGGTTNNPMNNVLYEWREGDRIRFVGARITNPTPADKLIFDSVILEFTGKALVVAKPPDLAWLPPSVAVTSNFEDFFIEVYRPKDEVNTDFEYFETGEWYPILYPGTASRDFSKRDFTWGGKTTVTASKYGTGASQLYVFNRVPFYLGDCHFWQKSDENGTSTTIYTDYPVLSSQAQFISMNPFELYERWERNTGFGSAVYSIFPVVEFKATLVRFGGKVLENSLVNSLNRFRFEDQYFYPSEYGRIRDLVNTSNAQVESVGAILLAIGEREAFSIYVNRTVLEDLSGRSQVVMSEKVLGSYNTLLGSHGTLNPESVTVDKGRVYWWDQLNGSWIRYGRDGLTAISDNKMRNWFNEIGELLNTAYQTATPPVAISEFDGFNEELVVHQNHAGLPGTFRDYTIYKGSLFSEKNRRWRSTHAWEPEMMARVNNILMSFKGGSLYLHERSGAAHSTFYGVKQDVFYEPVFNPSPLSSKSWQSIGVVSTHGWSVERLLSEFRGDKTIQQSTIPLVEMDEREDKFWAAILNDVNSTGGRIEGDKMRSKAIRALLKMDPAVVTRSLLHYGIVEYIDSAKNA